MDKYPEGLGVRQDDRGITLARTKKGKSTKFFLSTEEAFGFMETISKLKDQYLQQLQVKSGQIQPVVVVPISQFGIGHNALKTDVLLSLFSPTGEKTTFSLPALLGRQLAAEIPLVLAAMVEDEQKPS